MLVLYFTLEEINAGINISKLNKEYSYAGGKSGLVVIVAVVVARVEHSTEQVW